MWGVLLKFLVGILVSFYLFPVEFSFLPGLNTKNLLAAVGLVFLGYNYIKTRSLCVNRDFIVLSLFAFLVSLIGVVSVTYNNTQDFAYASYLVSMWVWLGGAYAVVTFIKLCHEKVSVELLCYYLMGVCAAQCVLALAMDLSPELKTLVDKYFVTTLMEGVTRRLYGIGCALDVAGTRFSAVLITMSVVLMNNGRNKSKLNLLVCVVSFLIIAVLGNMIARTTIIGLFVSLLFIMIKSSSIELMSNKQRVIRWIVSIILILIPILSFYYNTNPQLRENIRFAFEGFFSLAEKGEWVVESNDRLAAMIVFPESVKTWFIGDGYFDGPSLTDPYYVGPTMSGFYMWTDIGYLRFIFYFGLLGLLMFMSFFIKCAQICSKNISEYSNLFKLLLLLNFLVWFKVSTDIFVVYALFLCIAFESEASELSESK